MNLSPQVGDKLTEAASSRILAFIRRFNPAYADDLEARIISLSKEEQLNELTLVLATLEVPAPKTRATAALSSEDRALLEEGKSAVAEFRSLHWETTRKAD